MKKKLFKNIKFLVSIVLVLSLIAPSYASLNASDGSAFVTKAEFDSALADFNSRLTTFEAGINSKIDSQVTTYLDRNGIWSGKDQVLNSTEVETTKSGNGYYKIKNSFMLTDKVKNGKASDLGISVMMARNQLSNIELVSNISKSGLLYLQFFMGRYDGSTDFRVNIGYADNNTGDPSISIYTNNSKGVFYGYELFEKDKTGTLTLKETMPLQDQWTYPVTVDASNVKGYHGFAVQPGIYTKMFFVSKENTLVIQEVFQLNINGVASMYFKVNYPTPRANSGLSVIKCTVY